MALITNTNMEVNITSDYPQTLPCPLLDDNAYNHGATFQRSTLSYAHKQHRRPRGIFTLSLSLILTGAEMSEFRQWYLGELKGGILNFNADWDVDGNEDIKEFRFTTPYATTGLGNDIYKLSAEVELRTNLTTE